MNPVPPATAVIDATGRVLYAPNPRHLATRVTPSRSDSGALYLGGSWRRYPARGGYDLIVTVCGTHEGAPPPDCDRHIAWPLHDRGDVDTAATAALAAEVTRSVRHGESVLVRCYTGQNRSGLIVALAMRDLYGMSSRQVLDRLRLLRSPNVLCNPTFEAYLLALDVS